MNTLIAITTQPLKANCTPMAELALSLFACRRHTWKHANTKRIPDLLINRRQRERPRASHSTLYKIVLPRRRPHLPEHRIIFLALQHKSVSLALSLSFSTFLPRLFFLFSWISGESNYISVGLAVWR